MNLVTLGIPAVRKISASSAGRPNVSELVDRFGRTARDLRVSITERCSLRCTYCMPEEGLPPIPTSDLLTVDEIARLVGISVDRLGIREVRFTGGEPLMRNDLEEIVQKCVQRSPEIDVSMTTNGVGLERRVQALHDVGLARVNVSLDTVDPAGYATLTRRDRLASVLRGIRAARDVGLSPVKVNAVLMPETLDGAADLLRWCVAEGVDLRFIEQMPLDADGEWARSTMVSAVRLIEQLNKTFRLTAIGRVEPSTPAEEWLVDGGPASVGIIASVSRSFCRDCDRTRLTAEGTMRSCLFSDNELDLRTELRNGASDEAIAELWRLSMWNKWAGHDIASATFLPPLRSMGAIGG
ncbi:MAG: GTP 3',8-cyclase MoaA [Pseudonocardia sp.]|nr:MAG: GTP 3',8-cyclase MoaA [Pseudonocardia sp.]